MDVRKAGAQVFISQELLEEAEAYEASQRRWANATPEEREQWRREVRERREAERAESEPVPLTLDALLDKQGWTRAYAEHLLQPYCYCGPGMDGGWDYCTHADDVGVVPT